MRAQLIWVVGLNTFEICVMNADGTYIELDPSAMRSAGVGPSMIQRSENLSLALETRQPRWIRGEPLDQNLDRVLPLQVRVSAARYTSPVPPTPIWAAISYELMRVPEVNDTAGGRNRRDYTGMR
jgi:hypothetical protein